MRIFKDGKEIKEFEVHIMNDRNDNPIYATSKVRIFKDKIGNSYDEKKEFIVCGIIWENGGFHALNESTCEQFLLWQIEKEGIEVLNN